MAMDTINDGSKYPFNPQSFQHIVAGELDGQINP
jgi:hypothetical protein